MHKLLLALFLFTALYGKAGTTTLSMLNQVNAEWKNNADGQLLVTTVNTCNNRSFNDWIATHLMLVEQSLRKRSVQHLTAVQKENRFKLLDKLDTYWHAGTFPVNDYLSYKNPVFIDRIGTHCAVGYLMQQSGAESLARRIDADNKFVYVRAIKTKGVSEWAFENGFSIDELAWIQPSYSATFIADDMEGGLNGNVNALTIDPTTLLLYAGGSFNASTKGAACNGVAVYISGFSGWDWVGLGTGVNGTVNAMLIHNNMLYVGGEFTMAGTVPALNVAVFDLNNQQWQSMGNLDSTVNSLAVYNNEIYAGGKFTGLVSKWTGSQWQDITAGFIYNGEVRTLEAFNNELLIGGSFELLTGALRRNVASYNGMQMGASGFGTVTPVNDFEIYRDTIYAACDVIVGSDTCALARFVNSDWEVILKPYSLIPESFDGTSIQHLCSAEDRLFCVGNFSSAAIMRRGKGMMEFALVSYLANPLCSPRLVIDSTLRTMVSYNGVITFGGDFVSLHNNDTLNHVGQLLNVLADVSGIDMDYSNSISVFPNPATDKINVQFNNFSTHSGYHVKILDGIGREIYSQKIIQPLFSTDLSGHSSGIYMVHVLDDDGIIIGAKRVVLR